MTHMTHPKNWPIWPIDPLFTLLDWCALVATVVSSGLESDAAPGAVGRTATTSSVQRPCLESLRGPRPTSRDLVHPGTAGWRWGGPELKSWTWTGPRLPCDRTVTGRHLDRCRDPPRSSESPSHSPLAIVLPLPRTRPLPFRHGHWTVGWTRTGPDVSMSALQGDVCDWTVTTWGSESTFYTAVTTRGSLHMAVTTWGPESRSSRRRQVDLSASRRLRTPSSSTWSDDSETRSSPGTNQTASA